MYPLGVPNFITGESIICFNNDIDSPVLASEFFCLIYCLKASINVFLVLFSSFCLSPSFPIAA